MNKTYKHLFQYNLPADNNQHGDTDHYINIIASWHERYWSDGRPMTYITPLIDNSDLRTVKYWPEILDDCEGIAEKHFAEVARAQKIAEARVTLMQENEPTGVPTLDRFLDNVIIVKV